MSSAVVEPSPKGQADEQLAAATICTRLLEVSRRQARCDDHKATHRSSPPKTRPPVWAGPLAGSNAGLEALRARGIPGHPLGANPRDVWSYATASVRGHHATYPPSLIERPLLATCPERTCRRCGISWQRAPMSVVDGTATPGDLRAGCRCQAGWRPGLVLDPFFGAGTTGLVAERHGRDWLGIELNPTFAELARSRIEGERARRRRQTTSNQAGRLHQPAISSNNKQRKEVIHA